MSEILWRDEYAIGDPLIDRQHQELFRRVGDFVAACDENREHEVVAELFRFLEDYTVVHFMTEERVQRDSAYPGYEAHLKLHSGFIDALARLRERVEAAGRDPAAVREIRTLVTEWLVKHVCEEDRDLGNHLRHHPNPRRQSNDVAPLQRKA